MSAKFHFKHEERKSELLERNANTKRIVSLIPQPLRAANRPLGQYESSHTCDRHLQPIGARRGNHARRLFVDLCNIERIDAKLITNVSLLLTNGSLTWQKVVHFGYCRSFSVNVPLNEYYVAHCRLQDRLELLQSQN